MSSTMATADQTEAKMAPSLAVTAGKREVPEGGCHFSKLYYNVNYVGYKICVPPHLTLYVTGPSLRDFPLGLRGVTLYEYK